MDMNLIDEIETYFHLKQFDTPFARALLVEHPDYYNWAELAAERVRRISSIVGRDRFRHGRQWYRVSDDHRELIVVTDSKQ
jgi:hypothetical protein